MLIEIFGKVINSEKISRIKDLYEPVGYIKPVAGGAAGVRSEKYVVSGSSVEFNFMESEYRIARVDFRGISARELKDEINRQVLLKQPKQEG